MTNMTRVTLTGLLHEIMGARAADSLYHDLAGWVTIPLALAALYIEYRLLMHLFIETPIVSPSTALPTEGRPFGGEPSRSDSKIWRVISLCTAIGIVISSGTIHGSWTSRWKKSLGARACGIPVRKSSDEYR